MPLCAADSPGKLKKRRLSAPLHKNFVVPIEFLVDATKANGSYFEENAAAGSLFGKEHEAYVRNAYVDLLNIIEGLITERNEDPERFQRTMSIILRGSSGIGKSTFLAYLLANLMSKDREQHLDNVAIFRACKSSNSTNGVVGLATLEYYIRNGDKESKGLYLEINQTDLTALLAGVEMIVMDGCCLELECLQDFEGIVIVAASPSQFTKNLTDLVPPKLHNDLLVPALEEEEAVKMGKRLKIDEQVVRENFSFAGGITRYLFMKGSAKAHIDRAARGVDANVIRKMVSSQSISKGENQVVAHSLVLWAVPKNHQGEYDYLGYAEYFLVSRYVDRLISEKLVHSSIEDLRTVIQDLTPLSGAEGYAGALFEAYAIRKLQAGGKFSLRCLCEGQTTQTKELDWKRLTTEPVVVECNKLSESSVPFSSLHELDPTTKKQAARLLWPTTTNFPTFDCFYMDDTGNPWPLQMTISRKHGLKISGGTNTILYFDKMLGASKPANYHAVFVVPKKDAEAYTEQKYTGPGDASDVDGRFEQWVLGI